MILQAENNSPRFRFGIIGTGSFAAKRAAAIKGLPNAHLVCVADSNKEAADNFARKTGSETSEIESVVNRADLDAVIICAPNVYHCPLSLSLLNAGKHVFCEKPMAISIKEASEMQAATVRAGKTLKIGSNHRYFPAVRKAKDLISDGSFGRILSFAGRIGHNGERIRDSWFWNPKLSGGGAVLDTGWHLLDLARWFLGDFTDGVGISTKSYWKESGVDDLCSAVFLTDFGQMASISSSWRQYAGYLHIEINTEAGYIAIDGRQDAHGSDAIYWRIGSVGPIQSINFSHTGVLSQELELAEYVTAIRSNSQPSPGPADGIAILKMIDFISTR